MTSNGGRNLRFFDRVAGYWMFFWGQIDIKVISIFALAKFRFLKVTKDLGKKNVACFFVAGRNNFVPTSAKSLKLQIVCK